MRISGLGIEYVAPLVTVGAVSAVMAIGLNILGFSASTNVVTAAFTVAAVGGLGVGVIGVVALGILACLIMGSRNDEPFNPRGMPGPSPFV